MQNVNAMMTTMSNFNISAETLQYNSTVLADELDEIEEKLRLLQAQADEDARLIDDVLLNLCALIVAIELGYSSSLSISSNLSNSSNRTGPVLLQCFKLLYIYVVTNEIVTKVIP